VPSELEAVVADPAAGAVVCFAGAVRDHDDARPVRSVRYEAHPDAQEMLVDLLTGFLAGCPEVVALAVAHRHGDLVVGDVACVVAVSSAHRAEAFAACAQVLELVKAQAPVWKHQRYADGDVVWVGTPQAPPPGDVDRAGRPPARAEVSRPARAEVAEEVPPEPARGPTSPKSKPRGAAARRRAALLAPPDRPTLVDAPPLVDRFGRVHTDLRVSVTDRCPLRCHYCVPASGAVLLPKASALTTDEIVRVVAVAVACGVTKVRLTGGEPLVRPDLVELVGRLATLRPRPELCLTTSGLGLAELAQPLVTAGLNRVTVSLDTLERDQYAELTGRDALHEVLDGIDAVRCAQRPAGSGRRPRRGFAETKVNAVMVRGLTEHAAPGLLGWALDNDLELRFIEQMPLGGSPWDRGDLLTAAELLDILGAHHVLTEIPDTSGAPATRYQVDDGPGHVGIIAAVTRPFCQDCSRLRLTADGQLRSCLFATAELDLRSVLRSGANDDEVAQVLARCVAGKDLGHQISSRGFRPPVRYMQAIGG